MGSGQPLKCCKEEMGWHHSLCLWFSTLTLENCLELIKADAASRLDSGQEA